VSVCQGRRHPWQPLVKHKSHDFIAHPSPDLTRRRNNGVSSQICHFVEMICKPLPVRAFLWGGDLLLHMTADLTPQTAASACQPKTFFKMTCGTGLNGDGGGRGFSLNSDFRKPHGIASKMVSSTIPLSAQLVP
jgi:hypothetical protein